MNKYEQVIEKLEGMKANDLDSQADSEVIEDINFMIKKLEVKSELLNELNKEKEKPSLSPEVGQTVFTNDGHTGVIIAFHSEIIEIKTEEINSLLRYKDEIKVTRTYFEKAFLAVTNTFGEAIEVIGEQQKIDENGKIYDQYVYNIIGNKAKNGLPFVALKANILVD